MSISNHYLPLLCTHHVMPSTECGLHNGSSAIDHLSVFTGWRLQPVLMRPNRQPGGSLGGGGGPAGVGGEVPPGGRGGGGGFWPEVMGASSQG